MADRRAEDKGFRKRPRILDYLGAGGNSESDARDYAGRLVREARSSGGRLIEGQAPSPDEVRERRDSRRLRETRQES